jgi:enoyl-CoA hydratase
VAVELILTGRAVSAEALERWGLVNRLAEPGAALAVALELAQAVAASGPLATKASKQVLQHAFDWTDEQAWDLQRKYVDPVYASQDFQEGLRAFAEKRAPVWQGC